MNNTGKPLPLKHFTSRANLLSILESQSLRLSSTDNWIDKNDAASVAAYKRVTGAGDVRVLCLAQGREMVHHWFTYAPNDGCCIMLNAEKLLAQFDGQASFLHGHVTYFSRQDISAKMLRELPCEKLPFIKRRPYECEQEYRVIWSAAAPPQNSAPAISIKGCIENVTLAPGFPGHEAQSLIDLLRDRYALQTNRSRILNREDWTSLFDNLPPKGAQ